MRSLGILAVVFFGAASARAQDALSPLAPELPHVELEGNAPPTVKLNDAIGTALARNPTAAVAYAEIRRAQAIVEQVRSASLPTLYGSLNYTRLDAARTNLGVVQEPIGAFQANALLTVPFIVPKPWARGLRLRTRSTWRACRPAIRGAWWLSRWRAHFWPWSRSSGSSMQR
jgi:outer membrane protein TolC